MLDCFIGRGSFSKCKSAITLLRFRLGVLKKKKSSVVKLLRSDIEALLKSGKDMDAYGRAEVLVGEQKILTLYEIVEKYSAFILNQLPNMRKKKECPEECREAVSTLMFAAAKFGDLPELYNIRQIFTEIYGDSLESFVNQEFVEKKLSRFALTGKKVQLMKDIAKESSIKWDCTNFEAKLSNPPSLLDKSKQHESLKTKYSQGSLDSELSDQTRHVSHSQVSSNTIMKNNHEILSNGIPIVDHIESSSSRGVPKLDYHEDKATSLDGRVSQIGKKNVFNANDFEVHSEEASKERWHKPVKKEFNGRVFREDNNDLSLHDNETSSNANNRVIGGSNVSFLTKGSNIGKRQIPCNRIIQESSSLERQESTHHLRRQMKVDKNDNNDQYTHYISQEPPILNPTKADTKEETENVKPNLPRNMIPPYTKPRDNKQGLNPTPRPYDFEHPPYGQSKNETYSTVGFPLKEPTQDRRPTYNKIEPQQVVARFRDNQINHIKPEPQSVRSRYPKLVIHENENLVEVGEFMKNTHSHRRRLSERRNVWSLDDDNDDEEDGVVDKLLMHYSNKRPDIDEKRTASRSPGNFANDDKHQHFPSTTKRFPDEENHSEARTRPGRMASMPPELLLSPGRARVHPNLSDGYNSISRLKGERKH